MGSQSTERSMTVCAQCIGEAVARFDGVSFCERHYEMAVSRCGNERAHDWALDSTEVFSTSGGPVIRAFYMCLLCGAGVVARPGEGPEEAAMARLKEGLLRIERMLE